MAGNTETTGVLTEDRESRINRIFNKNPNARASFALGNDERQNPNLNVFDYYVGRPELKDLFFLPKEGGDWVDGWVNFSTPEEVENQFAFYLGANYISSEEYLLLIDAMKLTRQIHGNIKRKDGLRRSLNGHILPGMRVVFDNRHEIINSILQDTDDQEGSFFDIVFTFLSHDWLEDSRDKFLTEKIEEFPQYLVNRIRTLSHFKGNGVGIEEYSQGIKNSGRVEKFVKMIDRMVNLLDDQGRSPSLAVLRRLKDDPHDPDIQSKQDRYIEETERYYLEVFRDANLPLFGKFEQVLNLVKEDSSISKRFLTFVREETVNWIRKQDRYYTDMDSGGDIGSRRERSTEGKIEHIERMVQDLEKNASEYGILFSTGMVGAIYLHDLVKDRRFVDSMRSKLKILDINRDRESQSIARLLRYSLGIARGSRDIEDKSVIGKHLINRLYGDTTESMRELLGDIFSKPPKQERINKVNRRREAQELFREKELELYGLTPSPHKINFNTFRKVLRLDVEAVLLRSLEVVDNIKNPPVFDPTYVWRNCQESLYFLFPLLEAFGLKGPSKALKREINSHIYKVLRGQDFVGKAQEMIDQVLSRPELDIIKDIVTRVAGGDSVIEFDLKGIGSVLPKLNEDGRSVVTDLERCRIIVPPITSDKDLLEEAVKTIQEIVLQARKQGVNINIYRPQESVGEKDPKKAIRISLKEEGIKDEASRLIANLKQNLGIPEIEDLYELPKRPTDYADVKVVFQISPNDGSGPIYYEVIVVDSDRHFNNTFGSASRTHKEIGEKRGVVDSLQEKLGILRELGKRAMAYAMYSHRSPFLAPASQKWLEDRILGRMNSDVTTEIGEDVLDGVLMNRFENIIA